MTSAELRALTASKKPGKGKTSAKGQTSNLRHVQLSESKPEPTEQGYDTPKEQPGPKPGTPVRWEVATGEFPKQYPGMARVVVLLPETRLPELTDALGIMNQ